jgi:hypothetical protein
MARGSPVAARWSLLLSPSPCPSLDGVRDLPGQPVPPVSAAHRGLDMGFRGASAGFEQARIRDLSSRHCRVPFVARPERAGHLLRGLRAGGVLQPTVWTRICLRSGSAALEPRSRSRCASAAVRRGEHCCSLAPCRVTSRRRATAEAMAGLRDLANRLKSSLHRHPLGRPLPRRPVARAFAVACAVRVEAASFDIACRPRGFSPPRRVPPPWSRGFVAPRCRSWDSSRFASHRPPLLVGRARRSPRRRFTPLEEVHSTAAALRHRSRCPRAVFTTSRRCSAAELPTVDRPLLV